MKKNVVSKLKPLIPAVVVLVALAALVLWFTTTSDKLIALRIPGTDHAPGQNSTPKQNPVLAGKLVPGIATPPAELLQGGWPGFRGPHRDGISPETNRLARDWPSGGPKELWAVEVGEGYAGPAIWNGRVYLMDYDRDAKQDALRCLSLADGREFWRFQYRVAVKRNHGMSRTVPAVSSNLVVAVGPKCHVVALNPLSGELKWGIDLFQEYGATVPPWYAGQCPLLESNKLYLAPGGPDALLMAVRPEDGSVIWKTPNPHGWKMTHSSVMPMDFEQEHLLLYCADKGFLGVAASDGRLLFETADWKISIATVPSPLVLPEGRIFLSGGYNAGSLMLQVVREADRLTLKTLFKLEPEVFGATQHTPIFYQDRIFGVRPDGRFVCLTTEGKPVWTSDPGHNFGLGPFLIGNGMIFALNDGGLLRLLEASPSQFRGLAQGQVLKGRESWGPMALVDGRLLARDLTRLVCLDVSAK